jgi:hypothetical protein
MILNLRCYFWVDIGPKTLQKPGFYLHSRLLERAVKLNKVALGLLRLPRIETRWDLHSDKRNFNYRGANFFRDRPFL